MHRNPNKQQVEKSCWKKSISKRSSLRTENTLQLFSVKTERPGDQILEVEKLSFESNDGFLFKDLDLFVNKGDKIAVVSDDSLAVTSFFQVLMGEQQPTTGSFKFGTDDYKSISP